MMNDGCPAALVDFQKIHIMIVRRPVSIGICPRKIQGIKPENIARIPD